MDTKVTINQKDFDQLTRATLFANGNEISPDRVVNSYNSPIVRKGSVSSYCENEHYKITSLEVVLGLNDGSKICIGNNGDIVRINANNVGSFAIAGMPY